VYNPSINSEIRTISFLKTPASALKTLASAQSSAHERQASTSIRTPSEIAETAEIA
jgi:hypothetical protein